MTAIDPVADTIVVVLVVVGLVVVVVLVVVDQVAEMALDLKCLRLYVANAELAANFHSDRLVTDRCFVAIALVNKKMQVQQDQANSVATDLVVTEEKDLVQMTDKLSMLFVQLVETIVNCHLDQLKVNRFFAVIVSAKIAVVVNLAVVVEILQVKLWNS